MWGQPDQQMRAPKGHIQKERACPVWYGPVVRVLSGVRVTPLYVAWSEGLCLGKLLPGNSVKSVWAWNAPLSKLQTGNYNTQGSSILEGLPNGN